MRFRPTPQDTSFYELFAESARHSVEGAKLLHDIVTADLADRKEIREKLHEIEHQGDEATHAINNRLAQTFVTPFDRDDITHMAALLDDCIDYMDEAADLIVLYRIDVLPKDLLVQVEVINKCAELTAAAMPRLQVMDHLSSYWREVNRLENDGDQAYRHALKRLFDSADSGTNPIDIIKIKDIIASLENCVDSFERVAFTVESIALKES